jgi:ketosteroid isomerase-like protein
MRRRIPFLAVVLLPACVTVRVETPAQDAARRVADELLAADRAFSDSSARTDLVSGVTAMLAADAMMPVPGTGFAEGRGQIADALRRDTLNATSRARWTPVRAGISADGTHGFTIGLFDVTRADGTRLPGKYLAYWVKGAEGWRVAVWRRTPRAAGPVDTTLIAPALPRALRAAGVNAAMLEVHRASLAQAERDFSAEAQRIGIGPAFARFGSADAMHLGGRADTGFVRGNAAIARSVSQGVAEGTSPVHWGPDRVIVAGSGDLGVSIGYIRAHAPGADGQPRPPYPFFTVWRRADERAPWRYVAE